MHHVDLVTTYYVYVFSSNNHSYYTISNVDDSALLRLDALFDAIHHIDELEKEVYFAAIAV